MEHCLLLANSFHLSNLERTQCNINVSYLESIYKWERPHLYPILPYHIWLLPLLEVSKVPLIHLILICHSFTVDQSDHCLPTFLYRLLSHVHRHWACSTFPSTALPHCCSAQEGHACSVLDRGATSLSGIEAPCSPAGRICCTTCAARLWQQHVLHMFSAVQQFQVSCVGIKFKLSVNSC